MINKYIFKCEDCSTIMTFETTYSMAHSIGCVCGKSAVWQGSYKYETGQMEWTKPTHGSLS